MYLFKLDAIDSTNSFLREMSKNKDLGKWTAVTAEFQASGRGQKGSHWHAERGKNLICSILVNLNSIKAEDQFMLNCAVSLGIYNYLLRYKLPNLTVKWPNDIMSVSKKLGGVLIENTLSADKITKSIIGIGINVNQEQFPSDLINAVSVKQLTGMDTDRDIFTQDLLNSIQNKFNLIFEDRYDELLTQYESALYQKGKVAMYKEVKGKPFMGIIKGVGKLGTLQLERESGQISNYNFKEIIYL